MDAANSGDVLRCEEALADALRRAEQMDLTEADLPFLYELLEKSFAQWRQQAEGFPWPDGSLVALLHPDGRLVTALGPDGGGMPDRWDEAAAGPSAFRDAAASRRPARTPAEIHRHPALLPFDSLAVPVFSRSTGIPFAYFACLVPAGTNPDESLKLLQAASLHFRTCFYHLYERMFIADMWHAADNAARDVQRSKLLLAVLRRLHDHIDVDSVLSEIMDSLDELYPDCRIDLYLSQDYGISHPRVKPLIFQQLENEISRRAYLTGTLQEERQGLRHRVALPLVGKQGVYGVLFMDRAENPFEASDLRFLIELADASGIAFEKASLHEQANELVGELRIINEITQRLNSSLNLEETLRFATTELLRLFDAEYCCVLQKDPHTDHFVVITTNVPRLAGESLPPDSGFCGVLWRSREPLILSDYRLRTPVRSRFMDLTGSRSLLATPLMMKGEMNGAVFLAHRKPHYFSYENYKLLSVLSIHLGLALSNARLHEEVRRLSITDNLTGMYNRRYLDEIVQRRLLKDGAGALLLIDVDHFKQVNDTFGHQAGDAVLVQVSEIVSGSIRDSDIAARWGGDELAVYFPKLDMSLAARVAERIRKRVEGETRPPVTVSCGLAEWKTGEGPETVGTLFARADVALYDAKRGGRNRIALA